MLIAVLSACGSRTGLAGFGGAAPSPGAGGSSTGGAGSGAASGAGGIFGGGGVISSGGTFATGGLIGAGGFPAGGSNSGGNAAGGTAGGGTGGEPPFAYLDYFKSPAPDEEERYGAQVALSADGRTMAVGAPYDDSGAVGINGDPYNHDLPESGAVFVYVRQEDVWTLQAYIKAQNPDNEDFFGLALDLSASGDRLAVGATGEASIDGDPFNNDAPLCGAAYVFSRVGSTWTQDAYIKAPNAEPSDEFGCTVALSGDGNTLAVGACGESSGATGAQGDQTDNSVLSSGAVYVLTGAGSDWSHQAYLKASNTDVFDCFGLSLALADDGNTLVVGAPYEASSATGVDGTQADEGAESAGAAYVLERSGSSWSQTSYLKAINTAQGQFFGMTVDISGAGDTIAISATNERSLSAGVNGDPFDDSGVYVGAVYVLERDSLSWAHDAYIKASNPQSANFGFGLALTSDGNALLIGAIGEASAAMGINGDQADLSAPGAGAAYLLRRSPPAWQQTAYLKANNTASYANFGFSMALDDSAEIAAIGAPFENGSSSGINGNPNDLTTTYAGAVYVYDLE